MKILLDDCLPLDLRHNLGGHEVHLVQWSVGEKTDAALCRAAEAGSFDALMTIDRGNFEPRACGKLSILLLRPQTTQLEDLLPLVSEISRRLDSIGPGEIATVCGHS